VKVVSVYVNVTAATAATAAAPATSRFSAAAELEGGLFPLPPPPQPQPLPLPPQVGWQLFAPMQKVGVPEEVMGLLS
jgi:hypothetical protein